MISAALAVLETDEQRNELSLFYEKNKSRFYAIALGYLHKQEEAEDAVQEAFLKIANKPDTFFSLSDKKRIYYLYAVVKNVSVDMLNKSEKFPTEELSDDTVYRDDDNLIENTLFDNISHNEILSFVKSLPELQQNVLILVCLSELSISETAQVLKVSRNVVYQRLHLARKAIKKFIEERNKNDDGKRIEINS